MLAIVAALLAACGGKPRAAVETKPSTAVAPNIVYFEIVARDGTGSAPGNMPGLIIDQLGRSLSRANRSFRVSPPGGVPAGAAAYSLAAILTRNDAATASGQATIRCEVTLIIGPSGGTTKLFGFARGSATVEAAAAATVSAMEDCVTAVIENVLVKQIAPLVVRRAKAIASVMGSQDTAHGRGFHVTVPIGWTIDRGALGRGAERQGGLRLLAPAAGQRFRGSLVIVANPAGSARAPATSSNPRRVGTSTLITTPVGQFVTTCGYDGGDDLTHLVCDAVLRSFVVDP